MDVINSALSACAISFVINLWIPGKYTKKMWAIAGATAAPTCILNLSSGSLWNKVDRIQRTVDRIEEDVRVLKQDVRVLKEDMVVVKKTLSNMETILLNIQTHMASQDPTFIVTPLIPPIINPPEAEYTESMEDNNMRQRYNIDRERFDNKRELSMQNERSLLDVIVSDKTPLISKGVPFTIVGRFFGLFGFA